MKKLRGQWGFSTAGHILLCLTLTGVSGKLWLSCGDTNMLYTHKPMWSLQEKTKQASFTLSRDPVRRIPTCCILLGVARDLLHRFWFVPLNEHVNRFNLDASLNRSTYLGLSAFFESFSGVTWVAPSSTPFLTTLLPPALTLDTKQELFQLSSKDLFKKLIFWKTKTKKLHLKKSNRADGIK